MKGNAKVIEVLQEALKAELTAINQYFVHAEMCENWGYHRLSEVTKKEAIDEMKHAEKLIERILFLEAVPNMTFFKIKIGETVQKQLENDLALEIDAVRRYNEGIQICRQQGDNGSRDLIQQLLENEETHVDFLETQLHLIGEVGLDNYLSEQMGGNES